MHFFSFVVSWFTLMLSMLFRTLLALHRMATLHHDELGQVVFNFS